MNTMKNMTGALLKPTAFALCLITSGVALSACSSTSPKRERSSSLDEIDPALQIARQNRAGAREHYARATEQYNDGEYELALESYRSALELDDQLYAAWNNMGQLLMEQKNFADAVSAFQIAASIEPTDPRPLYNTGLAYQRVGWAADAYVSYEKALLRDEYYLPAMRGLARSAEMLGKGDRNLLETIKQAQLRETDDQWRDYFRAQYARVESLIDNR
jgi:tetratricopeptide (TPR) repeat protein